MWPRLLLSQALVSSCCLAQSSAASALDVLQLKRRPSVALPQTPCISGSELYSVCVQKQKSLFAESCSSGAAKAGSGTF